MQIEDSIMKFAVSIIEISISSVVCQHFLLKRDNFHHENRPLDHGNLNLHEGGYALHRGNCKLHHGVMKFHGGDEALLLALTSFQDEVDRHYDGKRDLHGGVGALQHGYKT
jgi:hypothetical protein